MGADSKNAGNPAVENATPEVANGYVVGDIIVYDPRNPNPNFKPEIVGIQVYNIKKMLSKFDKKSSYLLVSAVDIENRKPLEVSIPMSMVEQFGLSEVLVEGQYNTQTSKAIYLQVELLYVPNNGRKYGYIDKDGNPQVYRNAGMFVFRRLVGTIDGDKIRQSESDMFASTYRNQANIQEANAYFMRVTGRPYREGVSESDTEKYLNILMKLR